MAKMMTVSGRITARTGRGVVYVATVDGVEDYESLDEAMKELE